MKKLLLPKLPVKITSKYVVAASLACIVLIILAVLMFARSENNPSPAGKGKHGSEEEMIGESGLQTEDELNNYKHEVEVDISNTGFLPQTLRVPKNTRINWVNKDAKAHHIMISPGSTVPEKFENNHLIDAGGGYPFVISKPGTFHYYDVETPTLSGEVIVSD